MGVEIMIGIPATVLHPDGETPVSLLLEAPFWTGLPALIGAVIAAAVHAIVGRLAPPAQQSVP